MAAASSVAVLMVAGTALAIEAKRTDSPITRANAKPEDQPLEEPVSKPPRGKQETTDEFLYYGDRAPLGYVDYVGVDYPGVSAAGVVGEIVKAPSDDTTIEIDGRQEHVWVLTMRFDIRGQDVKVPIMLGGDQHTLLNVHRPSYTAGTKAGRELPFLGGPTSVHHGAYEVRRYLPALQEGRVIGLALPIGGVLFPHRREERLASFAPEVRENYYYLRTASAMFMATNNLWADVLSGEAPLEDAPEHSLAFAVMIGFPPTSFVTNKGSSR